MLPPIGFHSDICHMVPLGDICGTVNIRHMVPQSYIIHTVSLGGIHSDIGHIVPLVTTGV